MLWLIPIGFVVILILIAEYLSRDKRGKHSTDSSHTVGRESSSQKLYHSKTDDSAFFDGESEDYTDARQRIRQHY
ncbi:MAG: hypothetical protein PVG65_03120 [Candidatus Thorarchaeota archaeon]|jgi:hypothetical protein